MLKIKFNIKLEHIIANVARDTFRYAFLNITIYIKTYKYNSF